MFQRLTTAVLVVLIAASSLGADEPSCYEPCAVCGEKVCCPESRPGTETRYCWEIVEKEICIPAVRLPWLNWCEIPCGRVRTVKVLRRREYEVERCRYQWNIQCRCGHTDADCPSMEDGKRATKKRRAAVTSAISRRGARH